MGMFHRSCLHGVDPLLVDENHLDVKVGYECDAYAAKCNFGASVSGCRLIHKVVHCKLPADLIKTDHDLQLCACLMYSN